MVFGISRVSSNFGGVTHCRVPLKTQRRWIGGRCGNRENETAEQALKRRLRESQEVEQRVVELQSHSEFVQNVLNVKHLFSHIQQICCSVFLV